MGMELIPADVVFRAIQATLTHIGNAINNRFLASYYRFHANHLRVHHGVQTQPLFVKYSLLLPPCHLFPRLALGHGVIDREEG